MAKQEILVTLNLRKAWFFKIYVKFPDEQTSLKEMRSSYLGRRKFLESY